MRLRHLAAGVAGAVVGSVAALGLGDVAGPDPTTSSPFGESAAALPTKVPTATSKVLLAWTVDGLPDGLGDAVEGLPLVENLTVVRGDLINLVSSTDADGNTVDQPQPEMVIPLDAISFDPQTYPAFVPAAERELFAGLGAGEVLLGETSARLRRLDAGATMTLSGDVSVTVAGIVADDLVGAAEVAFTHAGGQAVGVSTERSLLFTYDRERAAVEDAVRAALPPRTAIRFRAPGETPFLRSSDAVLPQALIKEVFGEFAYRPPTTGVDFAQDPAWEAANIVSEEVPILGRVRCHRLLMPMLAGALAEVEREGLARTVDPAGYRGCWNPRFINGDQGRMSRHAWGAAVDVNWPTNQTGTSSAQDPRLVDIMERWGFTWGGQWLVPDAVHFEYLRNPPASG